MKPDYQIKPDEGIYIHIPFCNSKCGYCAFCSFPAEKAVKEEYITRLAAEIRVGRGNQAENKRFKSLYIGGGTPSELTVDQTARIVQETEKHYRFTPDAERTIEVNPFSGSFGKLEAYRQMGFNRLSIGIQSLSDPLLRLIGRPHTADQALETVQAATKAGFSNISVDLIFGLPGQTLDDLTESVRTLTAVPEITHLSAYSLSIEPGTRFDRLVQSGELTLPDEVSEREMQYCLNGLIDQAGFEQYEISNYARPGFQAVHNSSYWDLTGYLGFGLSASGYTNGVRYTNTADLHQYLSTPEECSIPAESHCCDKEEAMGDFMFLGLRRNKGVTDSDFRMMFGTSFFEHWPGQIRQLRDRGLLMQENDNLRLTASGRDLANQVFVEFV